ncbi:hypothetical protein EJB05_31310, partial [Eragrostis curvula]
MGHGAQSRPARKPSTIQASGLGLHGTKRNEQTDRRLSTVATGGEAAVAAQPTTHLMAPSSPSSPAGTPAWSVAVRLRHRGGLEIRASAENVLPGWGRGGERLSLLLRLRRRLVLAVTSQCGPRDPVTGAPPPCCKILRFLRSRWARLPRAPPIWRRKKPPVPAAPGARSQQNRSSTRKIQRGGAWTPTATLRFAAAAFAVVLASVALFYLKGWRRGGGCREPIAPCTSWRCFLAQFWEPPPLRNYKWLLRLLKQGLRWL